MLKFAPVPARPQRKAGDTRVEVTGDARVLVERRIKFGDAQDGVLAMNLSHENALPALSRP